MIPKSISRKWNLREVDVSKRMLVDSDRQYLTPMVEQVEFAIEFSEESQVQQGDTLFDPMLLQMYAEAHATYNELTDEIRKAINRYNDKMLNAAAKCERHTVYLLTRETMTMRKQQSQLPSGPPVHAGFDIESVASTSRKTSASKRPVNPIFLWAAGVKGSGTSTR